MNFFISHNSNEFQSKFQDGKPYVDAKAILKHVFSNGQMVIQSAKSELTDTIAEEGRGPLWAELSQFEQFLASKSRTTKTPEGESFNFSALKDQVYDKLYADGYTQFVSTNKQVELDGEKIAAQKLADAELEKLRKENADLLTANEARKQNEKDKAAAGINPVIRLLNDAWFPVLVSMVFAGVIGSFSYTILSETMELNGWLNAILAITWVLFPILCSIRMYEYNFFGWRVQPLWIVLVVDMVFTAYHVGWLRENGFVPKHELSNVIKLVYVAMIPLMQKGTNDMIMKIRATYLLKGWLPKVD